jgi:hypothetical protein
MSSTSCSKCNRPLSSNIARAKGLGPDCAKASGKPYTETESLEHNFEVFSGSNNVTKNVDGSYTLKGADDSELSAITERFSHLKELGVTVEHKNNTILINCDLGSDAIDPEDIYTLLGDEKDIRFARKCAEKIKVRYDQLIKLNRDLIRHSGDHKKKVEILSAATGTVMSMASKEKIEQIATVSTVTLSQTLSATIESIRVRSAQANNKVRVFQQEKELEARRGLNTTDESKEAVKIKYRQAFLAKLNKREAK